jgi:hypothetical protein
MARLPTVSPIRNVLQANISTGDNVINPFEIGSNVILPMTEIEIEAHDG